MPSRTRLLQPLFPTLAGVPTVAIIPVKSFAMGKQRLAGALQPEQRSRLGRALARHVTTAASTAGLLPVVVTGDADVAEWSTLSGFPILADPGRGLDSAATAGALWAMASGSRWIVVHSDLPLLAPSDLAHLESIMSGNRNVVAPSADGGTSAIGSHRPVTFSYGVSSFHRHLGVLEDPVVVTRPGLLLDVDSPMDLAAAIAMPRGRWMRDVLEG